MDRNTYLTPSFKLGEFLVNEKAIPAPEIITNLYRLANRLQVVRDILDKPITITSGYRNPEHNRQVGGEDNSYHTRGMAADIVVAGMSPREVQQLLHNWNGGLGSYATFTHLDIRNYKARWKG